MVTKVNTQLPAVSRTPAIIIISLLSLCFVNSYDGEFVFDDSEAIVNNDDVREGSIWDVFQNDFWGTKLSHNESHRSYRPLTILTFHMQYLVRGHLNPQDFHIVNIFLHTLVCVTAFFVFNVLLGTQNLAFYAAALFAVHPVHTEAVSGIVGRAELLCAMFTMLSILLYSYNVSANNIFEKLLYMSGCIICIVVAMLCKETGITAIGICVVYDITTVNKLYLYDIVHFITSKTYYNTIVKFVKSRSNFVLRLCTLWCTAVALLFARLSIMGFTVPKFQTVDNPAAFVQNRSLRVLNYTYIHCINAWLLLCPEWLCFDWSMGCVPLISGLDIRIFAILVFWIIFGLLISSICNSKRDKHTRYTVIGLVLLIIPFLPASNLFFNVGFVLAERTLYIPSAGYCLLLSIGLQKIYAQFPIRKILLLLFAVLIFIFFVRSWTRSNEWRAEKILFRSALRVCPLNAKVHYNIAKNAADDGNSSLAKLEYVEAIRLNPNYAQAMNNLGNLLKNQGQYLEAESLFKKAIKSQKNFAGAWMNLGIVLSMLKKYHDAEESYQTALSYRSKYPDCYYNLGVLYLEQKNYDKALAAWTNATRQKATHSRAWTNIVLLLDDIGMREAAMRAAKQALQFIPNHASIYFNMGNILGKTGKFQEAESHFKTAILKDPKDPMFYTNLGVLYHRWNKLDEAEQMYKTALKINPELSSTQDNLKKLYLLKSTIK